MKKTEQMAHKIFCRDRERLNNIKQSPVFVARSDGVYADADDNGNYY